MPSGINGPDKIEPEQSDNYEIGYRSASANSYMEIIGFHNDYEELTEICNVSAGCTVGANGVNNVGEAHVTGLEFVYRVNNLFAAPQVKGAEAMGSGIRYPMAISVTLQEAEHDATVTSSTKDGERIKYTPEEIYYVSLGAETNSWSAEICLLYTSPSPRD